MVDIMNEIVINCKLNCDNKIMQTEIIFYFLLAPVGNFRSLLKCYCYVCTSLQLGSLNRNFLTNLLTLVKTLGAHKICHFKIYKHEIRLIESETVRKF